MMSEMSNTAELGNSLNEDQAASPSPVVSVCIANYNGIDLINACIASVRAQTTAADVEIIVHDDASTDGSAAHIRANYPAVQLIESAENVGFCVANSRMAAVAQGDYLLLLNNDATLLPDAIDVLLREAQRLARPAILTLPQYDADTGVLLDIGCRLDPFLNPLPNRDPARNDVGTVHGACLWIDKALWDELGGFPEWFGSVAEDLYLCCRARLAAYPVRALGISGYRHRVGASFGGGKAREGKLVTTFRRRALSERNKTFVMALTYPAPYLQLALPIHLALLLIEGSLLSLIQGRLAYLRDIYWPVPIALYRQRRLLMAKRREIMDARRLASADFYAAFDWVPYKLRMLIKHGLPKVG
jgi:GT2 family glycosyltransferase